MNEEMKTAQTSDDESQVGSHADTTEQQKKEETVNEVEFKDTEQPEEKVSKPTQTREQNSENARRRREEERQKELKSTREQAIIEALDGKNPFTGEEMKDSTDVDEYLAMKEISRQGGDPLADFSKFQKRKEREKAEAAAKEEQSREWFRKDKEDFQAKYPKINLETLVQDKQFKAFADGKVGNIPLTDIYESYIEVMQEYKRQARAMARQLVANKKASPGALKTPGSSDGGYYTRDQVKKMSAQEVHEHYDQIRESMKRW